MQQSPEALDALSKYSILQNFGSSYTFETLDNIPFLNIQLMQLCMMYEAKSLEWQQRKGQQNYVGVE